jgi:lipid II:glycine glycyltransferase (peptidoglycan interpeptide bridge formation enzyme)
MNWAEFIRQAADDSSDIHLVGLFAVDDIGSRRPLAFATAMLHGQVAEYAHAGSTRDPGVRIPLHYAPTWELMRWARSRGATAWDFGGVVDTGAPDDAREGIDHFKFSFSEETRRVGSEWVLECSRLPWPLRPTRGPRH